MLIEKSSENNYDKDNSNSSLIGIYGIFDNETNKCLYVGQSVNIHHRWKQHVKLLKNKKHKRKNFVDWFYERNADISLLKFIVLEECESDELILNELEVKYFNKLKPLFYGKKPSTSEKWIQTNETKNKIKKSLMKNYYNKDCSKCGSNFNSVNEETFLCRNCRRMRKVSSSSTNGETFVKRIVVGSCSYCLSEVVNKKFCSSFCRNSFHNVKCRECDKLIDKKRVFCSMDCFFLNKSHNQLSYDFLYENYVVKKFSTRKIASLSGFSNVSVQNWLRKHNIPIRKS